MEFGERTTKAASDTRHMGVACHTNSLISKCPGMSPKANVALVGWDPARENIFLPIRSDKAVEWFFKSQTMPFTSNKGYANPWARLAIY